LVTSIFNDYIARHGRNSSRRLPLTRLVAGNAELGVAPLPDNAIVAEMMTMLFAGTDTTGTTLSYLFFELAQHPEWYARLRAELAALPAAAASAEVVAAGAEEEGGGGGGEGKEGDVYNFRHDAVQSLPVLNAVIWETLRTHPAVPTTLSRVAPTGGAPVAGRFMPAGTVVGVPAYTLQRHAAAFPAPDAWHPQRWLPHNTATTATSTSAPVAAAAAAQSNGSGSGSSIAAEKAAAGFGAADAKLGDSGGSDVMRAHMLVFGRGSRMCLGRAIAMMQMRLAVAAVARRFATVRLASAQTLDDMRQTDHFILMPKGHKCMLVFE
jgi:cytochrome P450